MDLMIMTLRGLKGKRGSTIAHGISIVVTTILPKFSLQFFREFDPVINEVILVLARFSKWC
jgi:hypothetical protein